MFEVEMDETEEEKDQRVWESRREREKVESGLKKEKIFHSCISGAHGAGIATLSPRGFNRV